MKKEEILVNCLDEIQSGNSTLKECQARHPEIKNELQTVAFILHRVTAENPVSSPDFKKRARKRLLEYIDSTPDGGKNWLLFPRLARKLGLSLSISLVVLLGGNSIAFASRDSLPEDTLYPVKIGVENIQTTFTFGAESKATRHLELAERRTQEIVTEFARQAQISAASFEAVSHQMDRAINYISELPSDRIKTMLQRLSLSVIDQQLNLDAAVSSNPDMRPELQEAFDIMHRSGLIAQVASGNPYFLSSNPSVFDEDLESAHFELTGKVQDISGPTWNINGLQISNVNVSIPTPPVGSVVALEGIVRNNQIFISKVEYQEQTTDDINIKGIFSGAGDDNSVWEVGGFTLNTSQFSAPPEIGAKVNVTGQFENGVFTVKNCGEGQEDEPRLKEVLSSVQPDKKTVSLDVVGADVTMSIKNAAIKNDDGQDVPLDQLNLWWAIK